MCPCPCHKEYKGTTCYCKCTKPIYQHPDYWVIYYTVKTVTFNLCGNDIRELLTLVKTLGDLDYTVEFPNK